MQIPISPDCFIQIVQLMHYAVVILNESGQVQFVNDAGKLLLGSAFADGRGDWFDRGVPNARRSNEFQLYQAYQKSGELADLREVTEVRLRRSDGSEFWGERSFVPLEFEGRRWAGVLIRDVDQAKRREMELTLQANTDGLTGLANRREFQEQLEGHLNHQLVLAILDIDQFKGINDNYGHPVGDDAIQQVAERLKSHFSDAFCLGRLGGDEFGVIISAEHPQASRAHFEEFLQLVSTSSTKAAPITASLGLANAQNSGCSARQLLTAADRMLYLAKSRGRNRVEETFV